MSNVHILYIDNDNVFQVEDVQDEVGGDYLTNAAVAVTVSDAQGNAVGGAGWPLSLVYVPASRGVYRATLPYTMDLQLNQRYSMLVTVDGGPGLHAEWTLDCIARARA